MQLGYPLLWIPFFIAMICVRSAQMAYSELGP